VLLFSPTFVGPGTKLMLGPNVGSGIILEGEDKRRYWISVTSNPMCRLLNLAQRFKDFVRSERIVHYSHADGIVYCHKDSAGAG
jgi:hypothetical protein